MRCPRRAFLLSFILLVLKDSLSLAADPEWGNMAAGWTGVTLLTVVVCFYVSFFMSPILF